MLYMISQNWVQCCDAQPSVCLSRAGSRVVRIDPFHFQAGSHTRQLIQVLSVLYLNMILFYCVVIY